MKALIYTCIIFCFSLTANGQNENEPKNQASKILERKEDKLVFGGYGQVDFSKPLIKDVSANSLIDVSRLVLSMGYKFSPKTSFFTEIEFEHVRELFVEQAFINHSFNDYINLRAGLMLIPMGIINEYHEPTTFNGVNRPSVDNIIVPTTWREIGIGFTGRLQEQGIKYQAYLLNGFSGYDGTKGLINGSKFLRDARQRGARSFMTSPDLSVKIDYYGVPGLKAGASFYGGKSESALFRNLDLTNDAAVEQADSSVLGITMAGLDLRYNTGGLALRGEVIFASIRNSTEYNAFTGNDAGRAVRGMYAEISYNLLQKSSSAYSLIPFFRFENYDTHYKVEQDILDNESYMVNEYVVGIGWMLAPGAILKTDLQIAQPSSDLPSRKTINAGIGVWF